MMPGFPCKLMNEANDRITIEAPNSGGRADGNRKKRGSRRSPPTTLAVVIGSFVVLAERIPSMIDRGLRVFRVALNALVAA